MHVRLSPLPRSTRSKARGGLKEFAARMASTMSSRMGLTADAEAEG